MVGGGTTISDGSLHYIAPMHLPVRCIISDFLNSLFMWLSTFFLPSASGANIKASFISKQCSIGEGTRITNSVIMDNVTIGGNCTIQVAASNV